MTTAADIIDDDLEEQLNDSDQDVWSNETLFKYITEAQNAIILLGVDANVVTEDFTLVQFVKQTIPEGGVRFIDVEQNVDGGPVRRIDKKVMDEVIPGWMTETSGTGIDHYMFEAEQPKLFWVYKKPSVGTLHIILSYAQAIPLITAADEDLVLSDMYIPAIKEYTLWRCQTTENESISITLAMHHLQNFYTLLGKKFEGAQKLKAVQSE